VGQIKKKEKKERERNWYPAPKKLESAQGRITQPAAREGMGRLFFVSIHRQCLKVIRSWTKSVKWAKSPVQTPGPDGQTDMPEWVQPLPPPGECKMWCSDEIISFWHPDRHKHSRQNLYIIATRAVTTNKTLHLTRRVVHHWTWCVSKGSTEMSCYQLNPEVCQASINTKWPKILRRMTTA